MSDLLNYRVRTYPAVSMPLRSGHTMYTTGPPTTGAITAFMLRVLEGMLKSILFIYKYNIHGIAKLLAVPSVPQILPLCILFSFLNV